MLSYKFIGFLVWGIACLIGGLCMVYLRSKPSNGLCLVYLQYLCAHVVFTPIVLVNETTTNVLTKRILSMIQDMILAFAARCYIHVGCVIWFKYRQPVHLIVTVMEWTTMLLLWIAIPMLHFVAESPQVSQYAYATYYTLAALFAYVAIAREMWLAIFGHNSPAYAEGANASSVFAGSSRLLFTTLGLIGGTWGMIDWILIILSAFGLAIWEASFLSRLFDSLFYVPPVVLYVIWWDCPVNVQISDKPSRTANEHTFVLGQ